MKRKFLTIPLILITSLCLSACSDANAFEVKSKKDTTYITIPAELNPSSELPKILIDSGFIEASVNNDNSVTYSISNTDYENFINGAKKSLYEYVDQINNDENSSISEVIIADNKNVFNVVVDRKSFEESDEELVVNALALKYLHYKAYTGEKISVKILFIDESTTQVYNTITIEQ